MARPSAIAESPRRKGPAVWLDMDQQALDDAYDQEKYAPNRAQIVARRIANSERTRTIIGAPLRRTYGGSDVEQLDIFRTDRPNAPVNVFIHGGAWRRNRAADYAVQAELFVRAGAHHVILDFITVDDAGGSLFPMAEQVRRAIAWLWRNAASFGGDRDRLYVTAHSSGSHLGGCLLTTDWRQHDLPSDIIKGALLSSGMYDLKPVRLSKRSLYVRFTDRMEADLSPQRHLGWLDTPLILAYGTCETPEFQRQTQEFFAAVTAAGKPAELLVGEGYNHFELLETLASPYGLVGRAALRQMRLA
jgi:arylformamidase